MPIFPTHAPSSAQPALQQQTPTPHPLSREDLARARQLADRIRARFAQTLVGQDNLRES